MANVQSQKINLTRFSDKYIGYYQRCKVNRINCLEGAYRAGKSVINVFSFASYLDICEDTIHLVSGYSVASARLNVSECNGLGLKYLFGGRCRAGTYERNECLFITDKRNREKIVIFVGGGKSDSYKTIQGLSFGSWLSVELANLYISDDEKCFISMALSRLTQSKLQRVWWDLNPTYPSHKVYKKFLDVYYYDGTSGGYNYMVCTLFDNSALTPQQRQHALSLFPDKDSVSYKRNILGMRSASEGIIFTSFAQYKDVYVIYKAMDYIVTLKKQFISVGVDFGGNGSNTTFVASLISNNYSNVFVLYSDKIDMSKPENATIKVYEETLFKFLTTVVSWGVGKIRYVFGDCADTVMINETRRIVRMFNGINKTTISVSNCIKHTIKERIDTKTLLLARGNYHIFRKAESVIESTETQVWDSREGHEDERLDNRTVDIDTADAEEYSWSAFLTKLVQRNMGV